MAEYGSTVPGVVGFHEWIVGVQHGPFHAPADLVALGDIFIDDERKAVEALDAGYDLKNGHYLPPTLGGMEGAITRMGWRRDLE